MIKVLLVEDDVNLGEIYKARLEAEGYQVYTAKDGEEGLLVAKANQPDLLISDVMMPRVSGMEMLEIIKSSNALKNMKVIMLTALNQNTDEERAKDLGADRYLVKSQVTLEDIVSTVKELLSESSSTQPAEAAPAAPAPDMSTPTTPEVPTAEPVSDAVSPVSTSTSINVQTPEEQPMPEMPAAEPAPEMGTPEVAPSDATEVNLNPVMPEEPSSEPTPEMSAPVNPEMPAAEPAPAMDMNPTPTSEDSNMNSLNMTAQVSPMPADQTITRTEMATPESEKSSNFEDSVMSHLDSSNQPTEMPAAEPAPAMDMNPAPAPAPEMSTPEVAPSDATEVNLNPVMPEMPAAEPAPAMDMNPAPVSEPMQPTPMNEMSARPAPMPSYRAPSNVISDITPPTPPAPTV